MFLLWRRSWNEKPIWNFALTWEVCCRDFEYTSASLRWRSNGSYAKFWVPRTLHRQKNVLHNSFSDIRGIVHREFALQDQTINREIYYNILKLSKEDIQWKRICKARRIRFFTTTIHAVPGRSSLAPNNTVSLPRPAYSPDLASVNLLFFSKRKNAIQRLSRSCVNCKSYGASYGIRLLGQISKVTETPEPVYMLHNVTISKKIMLKLK